MGSASRLALMRRYRLPLAAALLCIQAHRSDAQTPVDWVGNADGDWAIAANWSSAPALPGANNDVVNATTFTITHSGGDDTINSLLSSGAFTLSGGSLTGAKANSASAFQVNNAFLFSGGKLKNFTLNTSTGGQPVTFDGNFNVLNSVISNAALSFGSNSFAVLQNANIVNGDLSLADTGPGIQLDTNATLTISATGLLHGYGGIGNYSPQGGSLINLGQVDANVSGKTLNLPVTSYDNQGTTSVESGATLLVNGASFTSNGTVDIKSGGAANITTPLTQTAGTTRVNGTLTGPTGGNGVTIDLKGGDLVGNGTISGDVKNEGGTVRAGDLLPGVLTVNGAYTQTATGKMEVDLGGATQGVSYDLVKAMQANLDGELDIKVVGNYTLAPGQTYDFLTYGSRVGQFSNIVALNSGYGFTVGYNDTLGVGTLTVVAAVPESSSLLSAGLLLGLGGLALRRLKRNADSAICCDNA